MRPLETPRNAGLVAGARIGKALFPKVERHIAILDHVRDLPSHGDEGKHAKIDYQYWPEHGYVENRNERAEQREGGSAGGGMPELEFGKTPDKRAELVVRCGRQASLLLGLGLLLLLKGRIKLG